ncbi:MAG: hypothetical protein KGQ41_04065, partial [Alphaproteobacteria bacterium]|nr:hypothetical protein [Alphaproteobacteria bacterium]
AATLMLGAIAGIGLADQVSAQTVEKPVYTGFERDPAKSDKQALSLVLGILNSPSVEDKAELIGDSNGYNIAAAFLDKDKKIVAMQVTDGCGIIGCMTLIFVQTDPAKNIWTRAFQELAYNLWAVNDGTGVFKIAYETGRPASIGTLKLIGSSFESLDYKAPDAATAEAPKP